MPGLPMFGHGQIEGFAEKYGMEYKRAYYDEFVDDNLVRTHEDQIFPLMKKRYLFSQVENFEFFDFVDDSGNVNESVFAYTNRSGNERAFVLYNNSYQECSGTVKYSVEKAGSEGKRSKSLAEALNLKSDHNVYYIFRDYHTKFEYILPGRDIFNFGRFFYLRGYEYVVMLDFREVYDTDGTYAALNEYLHGEGVYSIEDTKRELTLAPLHKALSSLLEPMQFNEIKNEMFERSSKGLSSQFQSDLNNAVDEINKMNDVPLDKIEVQKDLGLKIKSASDFTELIKNKEESKRKTAWFEEASKNLMYLSRNGSGESGRNIITASVLLKELQTGRPAPDSDKNFFRRFLLDRVIPGRLRQLSPDQVNSFNEYELLKVLSGNDISSRWTEECKFISSNGSRSGSRKVLMSPEGAEYIKGLMDNDEFRDFINVHEHLEIVYFNKEKYELVLDYLFTLYNLTSPLKYESKKKGKTAKTRNGSTASEKFIMDQLKSSHQYFKHLKELAASKGYRFNDLKSEIKPDKVTTTSKTKKKTSAKKSSMKPTTNKRGKGE